jgi:hypothetical protein
MLFELVVILPYYCQRDVWSSLSDSEEADSKHTVKSVWSKSWADDASVKLGLQRATIEKLLTIGSFHAWLLYLSYICVYFVFRLAKNMAAYDTSTE